MVINGNVVTSNSQVVRMVWPPWGKPQIRALFMLTVCTLAFLKPVLLSEQGQQIFNRKSMKREASASPIEHNSNPQWSRGNVLVSRFMVRGFIPG